MTPLDQAHAAMQASDAEPDRLRFFERLADAELFLLLEAEPEGEVIEPMVFDTGDAKLLVAFDREDRLTGFTGTISPYAALSGRAIAEMIAGSGYGLGVNLDAGDGAIVMPAEAMDWLHETLSDLPQAIEERPLEIAAPKGLPEVLLQALDTKLALAEGLASAAFLVSVIYAPARPGHLLAFIGSTPYAEDALAKAVSEALVFSGLEAGELDVAFFSPDDPIVERLAKVGLRFDLPEPVAALHPIAPGSDPDKPPKLK